MSGDSICRSCVIKDVKMFRLDKELQEIYEKLTSINTLGAPDALPRADPLDLHEAEVGLEWVKISIEDKMPNEVCFMCYSHLQRCKRFSEVALHSQQLLKDWLGSGDVSQELQPCKLLDLQVVQNLCVTIARSDQHSPDSHSPEELEFKEENVNIKMETMDETDEEYTETPDTDEQNSEKDTSSNAEGLFPRTLSKPFSCRKCSKAFSMSKNLIEHMKICLVDEDLTCKICDVIFTHFSQLNRHNMLEHTQSDERPFACNRCKRRFKTTGDLSVHSIVVHHSADKKHACEVCGKAVTDNKTHMLIHEGTKEFVCTICGKAFSTKGNLKGHMQIHTGERPFQCSTCGQTFGFKCSLKLHIQKMHTEVKPYPCDKCYRSFNQEAALTSHQQRSHNSSRSYKCEKCDKSFTSACILKNHMDVHSKERPFYCSKCGKHFKRPDYLKKHFKTLKCNGITDISYAT